MKISRTALTVSLLAACPALAAAELHIPMAFEYLALDGRKVSRSMVVHKSELELTPGYHEIAIRYNDMVELDMPDTPENVKSTPFIITLDVSEDVDYYLKPAGGDTVRNPLEFAQKPDVVITRKDGSAVDYRLTYTDIDQRDFKTHLYGKTLSPQAQAQAAAAAAAAASTQLVPVTESTGAEPATTVSGAPASSAATMGEVDVMASTGVAAESDAQTDAGNGQPATPAEMLQLWWLRADEKTRKEFLGWAIKQL